MRILDPHRKPAGRASAATLAAILGVGMFVLPTAQVATAQEPGKREVQRLRRQLDRLQNQSDQLRHRLDALEHRTHGALSDVHRGQEPDDGHAGQEPHGAHSGQAGHPENHAPGMLHELHDEFVQHVQKVHDSFVEQHREQGGQHGDLQRMFQQIVNSKAWHGGGQELEMILQPGKTDKTGNAALHDIFVQHLRNTGHDDLLATPRIVDDAPHAGHAPHREHGDGHTEPGDQPRGDGPGHVDPRHRTPGHDALYVEHGHVGQPGHAGEHGSQSQATGPGKQSEHGQRRRGIRL